jgi:CDP-2,3-bis-(O-geranylgeranyl)-sn-glycerol synthase
LELVIDLADVLSALLFIIPSYAANSVPAIFGGGTPIDLGRRFIDGERIFGSHKTIKGFASGLSAGFLVSILIGALFSVEFFASSALTSIGALGGDLLGAFIKRRLKLPPGYPLPLLDQLDFVFGGLLILYPFYRLSSGAVFLILVVTPAIHVLANMIAYLLRFKETFW